MYPDARIRQGRGRVRRLLVHQGRGVTVHQARAGWHGRGGTRFFRLTRGGRAGVWSATGLVNVKTISQGHELGAQTPETLLQVHSLVRRRRICKREKEQSSV